MICLLSSTFTPFLLLCGPIWLILERKPIQLKFLRVPFLALTVGSAHWIAHIGRGWVILLLFLRAAFWFRQLPTELADDLIVHFHNSLSCLGTYFEVLHVVFFGDLFSLVLLDDSFWFQIDFVGHQYPESMCRRLLINCPEPHFYFAKTLIIGAIVDEDDAVSSPVETLSHSAESLLTGRVHQRYLHLFFLQLFEVDYHFGAQGCQVTVFRKIILSIPFDQAGLADVFVTYWY